MKIITKWHHRATTMYWMGWDGLQTKRLRSLERLLFYRNIYLASGFVARLLCLDSLRLCMKKKQKNASFSDVKNAIETTFLTFGIQK